MGTRPSSGTQPGGLRRKGEGGKGEETNPLTSRKEEEEPPLAHENKTKQAPPLLPLPRGRGGEGGGATVINLLPGGGERGSSLLKRLCNGGESANSQRKEDQSRRKKRGSGDIFRKFHSGNCGTREEKGGGGRRRLSGGKGGKKKGIKTGVLTRSGKGRLYYREGGKGKGEGGVLWPSQKERGGEGRLLRGAGNRVRAASPEGRRRRGGSRCAKKPRDLSNPGGGGKFLFVWEGRKGDCHSLCSQTSGRVSVRLYFRKRKGGGQSPSFYLRGREKKKGKKKVRMPPSPLARNQPSA